MRMNDWNGSSSIHTALFLAVALFLSAGSISAATLYWDGGGANNNWSTVANWNTLPDGSGVDPVAAPVAGDDIVFASGATAQLSNSCNINLSGGTGITITLNNPSGNVTIAIAAAVKFKSGTAITVDTNDSLILTAGAGTITLDGAATFDVGAGQSLSIAETINNSTFTLTVQGDGDTLLSGVISSTGGITKAGVGTLTLGGANTYTGATTINEGSLATNAANRIADANNVILADVAGAELTLGGSETIGSLSGGGAAGGNINLGTFTLTVTQSAALTYAGVISGTGGLTKAGASALTLSGDNTYTGATTINAGSLTTSTAERIADTSNVVFANVASAVLTLGGNETIGSLSGGGTTGGNIALGVFTLTVTQSAALTFAGVISGSGGLTKEGASALTLSGTNTYTGATTINAGSLTTSAANKLADASEVVLADAAGAVLTLGGAETIGSLSGGGTTGGNINLATFTLTVTQGAALTYDGVISGSGGLTKAGASALTLSGANTYTGATTINAGSLTTSTADRIADTSNVVFANVASAVLTLGGNETIGSLSGGGTTGGNIALGAFTLTVTQGAALTYGGVISGAGGLTKAGASALTLSGANTYTGPTTINAGGLTTSAAERIADTSTVVFADAAGAVLTLGGNETFLSLSGGGTTGGNIDLGTFTLTVNQSTALTYGGIISGTGGLTKAGAQTLTLGGANTYTGATTINAGSITTNAANRIADTSDVILANIAGVVLTLGGNETIRSLSGGGALGGNIALGAFTLTVNQSAGLTYGGVISGTGGLTKAGGGELTLGRANTYTGATTITAGGLTTNAANRIADTSNVVLANVAGAVLTLGGAETIGSLSGGGTTGGNVNMGAFTLTVTQNLSSTYGGIISGAGGLTKGGPASLTLSGANTYTGTTTINAGGLSTSAAERIADTSDVILANIAGVVLTLGGNETIRSLSGGGTTGGNINLDTYTLIVNQNAALTYGGVISGAGGLTKTGAQTLTISGANTYTGATTIIEGGLTTSAANRIADLSDVVVANTADVVLTLGGAETIGSLSGGGTTGGDITLGANTLTVTQNLSSTYGGVISGTGGLTKEGSATLTLSGANTYTGATTINDGRVSTNAAERIADVSDVVLANTAGAALTLGGDETIRSLSGGGTTGGNITLGTFTLMLNQNAALTYGGIISGSGGLTKAGASRLTLTGANSFTGAVNVNAGPLTISHATATGSVSGGVVVASGASLEVQGGIAVGAEPLTLNGGAANELVSVSGSNSWAGTISLATAAVDIVVSANDLSIGGIISGGQVINKAGTGTLILTGANTFTGALNVTAGTCNLSHTTGAGTTASGVVVSAGASLQLQNNISVGAESLTLNGGAAVELENVSGVNSWSGVVTLATAAVDIKSTAGNLTFGSTISGQSVTFNCNPGNIIVSGAVGAGGAQTLTKSGTGTLTLNGNCNFTGGSTINGGVVNFNGANVALGTVVANNYGTKIAGTGTLPAASNVIMNDGTIFSPGGTDGNDVGTITINGNLTFNFESKFIVTVTGASGADKIICGGNIIASGNTPNIVINARNTADFVYPAVIMTITGSYAKFDESSLLAGWDIDDIKVGNDIRITMATVIIPTFTEWGLILFALLIATLAIRRMREKDGLQGHSS